MILNYQYYLLVMTNRVSDFLTIFFAGKHKSFVHFAFGKKYKGMETAWYRGHGRGKERLIFSSPQSYKVLVRVKSPQSYLTLCNPMDCSPPCSSVHGILQARILEWVAVPSSRGYPRPGARIGVCLDLEHCRQMIYPLNHLRSPLIVHVLPIPQCQLL